MPLLILNPIFQLRDIHRSLGRSWILEDLGTMTRHDKSLIDVSWNQLLLVQLLERVSGHHRCCGHHRWSSPSQVLLWQLGEKASKAQLDRVVSAQKAPKIGQNEGKKVMLLKHVVLGKCCWKHFKNSVCVKIVYVKNTFCGVKIVYLFFFETRWIQSSGSSFQETPPPLPQLECRL